MLLLIPGPVTTHPDVRAAAAIDAAPWDNAFRAVVAKTLERVRVLAGGEGGRHAALALQGCGHFVMEAAVRSFLPPGGRILVPMVGAYADRLVRLAREAGRDPVPLAIEQNRRMEAGPIAAALRTDPTITHLGLVYSETATGVVHDIPVLAELAAALGRRVLVDAVSAFGALPFDFKRLSAVDAVMFTANKCIEGLPGLAFAVCDTARLEACAGHAGSWSFDLADLLAMSRRSPGSFRFTPPAQVILAFARALDHHEAEGRAARLARYTANMRVLYEGVIALGLAPCLPPKEQGPIIVNVRAPDDPHWDLQGFVDALKRRGVLISNFHNTPEPSFRVGCIGAITPDDMQGAVAAIGAAMGDIGVTLHPEGGLMRSDLEIARATQLRPIAEIAARAGIPADALEPYGRFKAKIGFDFIDRLADRPEGALVLVTGISPTPAGEGKTTTTVGLGDALNRIGRRAMICLREPSLGPSFGMKGGAAGGGRAQVAPMDEINLHFTGDFHAITSANNLLAALLDNHLFWGNALGIDPRRISWRRALDMNDRALRQIVAGLGAGANGAPREDGFDITVASEVMAVFCLARDLADLQTRLGRIEVARRRDGTAVTAQDLEADGAMAVLLRDALMPNLVQTLEGSPALVHGGPFANIAHGCNSVMATRLGLRLADVVVTEAGFGADLGAEKFFNIKCRAAGLAPDAAVVVATVRALKMHGGVAKSNLGCEDVAAVLRGIANLARHVENVGKFGVPVVVGINRFTADTDAELAAISAAMAAMGVETVACTHWADGGAGAEGLARAVERLIASGAARFRPLYPDALPLAEKIRTIAREIYRAADIALPDPVAKRLAAFEAAHPGLPVCIAKTQYSFSADPTALGAPEGHILPVREVRLSAGAGFVVAICGDIMTMPGLPRSPAAAAIRLRPDGGIDGLF